MSTVTREHFVTFFSPGTFVSESITKPIERHDPKLAVTMAESVVERFRAKPYAFRFGTRIRGEMPDGEGGVLRAEKLTGLTGLFFLGGKLESYAEIERLNAPDDEVLRQNMRANRFWIVCVNTNSFRMTVPFDVGDRVVGPEGEIVHRGDDPEHVAYRSMMNKRLDEAAAPAN